MATYFPNLDLGGSTNGFQFGLGGQGVSFGSQMPTMVAANPAAVPNNVTPQTTTQQGMFSSIFNRNSMFGGTDPVTGNVTGGWVSPLASIGAAIFSGIQGQKQLGLAQKQFQENKRQFDANFEAQRKTTNTQLEDRQRARVASNAGAYESVDSYLKRNSV